MIDPHELMFIRRVFEPEQSGKKRFYGVNYADASIFFWFLFSVLFCWFGDVMLRDSAVRVWDFSEALSCELNNTWVPLCHLVFLSIGTALVPLPTHTAQLGINTFRTDLSIKHSNSHWRQNNKHPTGHLHWSTFAQASSWQLDNFIQQN